MPWTVLSCPMHLMVMLKGEPNIRVFKRPITIVLQLMDPLVSKRASLSCSEEKLASYNEYVLNALNIFSETKLLLSVVALGQVSSSICGWDGYHDHLMNPFVARRSPWPMGLHELLWPNAKMFTRFKMQLYQLIYHSEGTQNHIYHSKLRILSIPGFVFPWTV